MRFTALAFAAAAARGVFAAPRPDDSRSTFGCAAPEPDAEHRRISQMFAAQEAEVVASGNFTMMATVTIDTYFHVVASSTSLSGGYVTDKMLYDQLDVLNAAYAPHGFQFNLKEITRTVNAQWAVDGNGYEMTMKRQLRKGSYAALNIYFLKDLGSNMGYCYFPTSGAGAGTTTRIRDGCTVLYSTVPGGSKTNYNLGHTVTHEVGHWMGLYHTFQGGCNGVGDSVADTPAQASASSGCPIGRDSCPNQPGLDPIHNYMDYSYDSCYEEFTPGQRARMESFWKAYRQGK
ncbi:hypothetical protein VTJ04DRAFT_8330 [Mycothermus thermophilus]|uniref:uncharacterized protein n=1 Tax=Humicola insolens TaxID=85995 RepID=UPI003744392A